MATLTAQTRPVRRTAPPLRTPAAAVHLTHAHQSPAQARIQCCDNTICGETEERGCRAGTSRGSGGRDAAQGMPVPSQPSSCTGTCLQLLMYMRAAKQTGRFQAAASCSRVVFKASVPLLLRQQSNSVLTPDAWRL